MHLLRSLLVLAAAAAAVSALPSYSSPDNAYPEGPSNQRYKRPTPTSTPCTTTQPPTSTPCSTSTYKPTPLPEGADSRNGVQPQHQTKCPLPTTITLPAETRTETRTVHAVRTATVTSVATVTATSVVVKPEVHTKVVEKPVYHTVTKVCTKTTTVQEYVTKTKTCKETTTVQEYVTKTKTLMATQTVTKEHVVTKTVGALPTEQVKAPAPAYGKVEPYQPPAPSAYGPVEPYKGDSGAAPTSENKYDSAPLNLNTKDEQSAYGYQ